MKEFLLSFDNTQQKRQKELLMEYKTYSIRKQYLFVYQRDGISLDVECFKDLVSFSKKPTRSSLLCFEWVSHREPIRLQNNLIQIKNRKPFMFLPITNLTKMTMNKSMVFFNNISGANIIFNRYAAKFENFLIEPKDKINVNILKNSILKYLNPYKTNIFKNNFYYKDYILNKFENEILSPYDGKHGNIFENPIAEINHTRLTTIFDTIFLRRELYVNVFNISLASISSKILNIFEYTHNPSKDNKTMFMITQFMAENVDDKFDMSLFNETLLGMPFILHLNLFENFNVYDTSSTFRNINVFDVDLYKKTEEHKTNFLDGDFAFSSFKIINNYKQESLKLWSKNINVFPDSSVRKVLSGFVGLYNDTILVNKNSSSYLQYFNDDTFLDKYIKQMFKLKSIINASKDYQHLFVSDDNISVFKNLSGNLATYTYTFVNKNISNIFVQKQNIFINKYYMSLNRYNDDDIWIHKYSAGLSAYHSETFVNSISKDMNLYHTDQKVSKINYPMFIETYSEFISKTNNEMTIYDKNFYYITKINHTFSLLDTGIYFNKYSTDLHTLYQDIFIDKLNKNIRYGNDHIDIDKISATMFLTTNNYYMQKFVHNIFLNNDGISFLKEYRDITIETDYIHDIIKNYIPVMLNTGNDKALIAINKINKPLFTKDLLVSISKQRANAFDNVSSGTIFVDKNFKNIFALDNLFCDKLERNSSILDLINESIIKNQIRTWFINEDTFIDKYAHGSRLTYENVFIDKNNHPIFLPETEWVDKLAHNTTYFAQQDTFQTIRNVFEKDTWIPYTRFRLVDEFDNLWFSTIKHVFFHQDIPMYKQYKGMFDQTGDRFFNRPIDELGMFPTSNSLSIDRYLYIDQIEQITRANNFPMEFYEQFFLTRDMLLNIVPGFDELDRIIKEANISSDPVIDWAWTYQEDEPFDDPFKIDELLLPENDSRYEDFENIIFNKETGKPRNPVQIIDDYTFIAKYPNHYPIKDENGENAYKNIAVEYLDVRTSIMRQVFLGYYKLWQDHIFEFSRMTIPQSAKKILDYLYAWILVYFPEEDIPEALRTFRLVRWYLERGIIETSEYCITFTPKDLKSDMTTTQLNIPCDLYPREPDPQNNTMFVDTSLRVVRNNPNRLRRETHLKIYIDNKKETLISFSLHTLTPVYIILNEEMDNETILDSITIPTTGKMVYNIPYTGDTNTLTIKKYAIDNNDNEFYIGNIIIQGMNTKDGDLEINFNPSKIQGNKVLNYVSQKVMAYANLYMNNEEAINEFIKGNIHLSEVYDHLLEYWNLHWQDKDKGKRLTIKRT